MEPKYNMINFDKLIKPSNRKTLSLAQSCPPLCLSPSAHQRLIRIASSLEGELEDRQTRSAHKEYQPMSTTEKPIPTSFVDCISSSPTTTAVLSNFQVALIRIDPCGSDIIEPGVPYFDPLADGPVIQAAATRSLARGTNSNKILAMWKEPIPISSVGSISLSTARATSSNSQPIPRSSVGSSSLLSTARAMLSNSQGELADKLTRLRKELKQTMYLYCKEYQAMSATGKEKCIEEREKCHEKCSLHSCCLDLQGELEDKLTKLLKELEQTMSDEDLYNSAGKELQAMSPERLYNFARHSPTVKDMFEKEKRSILELAGALSLDGAEAYCKYHGLKGENVVATTSGANMNFQRLRLVTELAGVGRQREAVLATYMPEEPGSFEKFSELGKDEAGTSKGRMEGEGDQDEDPRSLPKEELKDVELLIPIPTSEERERSLASSKERERRLARAEERERSLEEREHSLKERERSLAAEERECSLEERERCLAARSLSRLEERERSPEVRTTGSASHVTYNTTLFSINATISASPRFGWNNREKRGNDVEVSGSR